MPYFAELVAYCFYNHAGACPASMPSIGSKSFMTQCGETTTGCCSKVMTIHACSCYFRCTSCCSWQHAMWWGRLSCRLACFDGFNCCPEDVQICGGTCCNNNRVCLQNQCVAAGSTPCGTAVCSLGQQCSNNVCCDPSRVVCGSRCCDQGQQCLLGQCAAAGATACGANMAEMICSASQQGICCGLGETNCCGRCCGMSNTCLLGRYCVPQGGHVAFVVAVMACFTLHAARCSASTTHMLNRTEQSFQENKQDGAKSCLPLYTCAHTHTHTHTCTKTNKSLHHNPLELPTCRQQCLPKQGLCTPFAMC
jgi:hypothetical protein